MASSPVFLGSGSYGRVVKVGDDAIKTVKPDPEYPTTFSAVAREALLCRDLFAFQRQSNMAGLKYLVEVRDVRVLEDGTLQVKMRVYDGTMFDVLTADDYEPTTEIGRLAMNVRFGLEFLHVALRRWHRDISTSNIFYTGPRDPRFVLGDLGAATNRMGVTCAIRGQVETQAATTGGPITTWMYATPAECKSHFGAPYCFQDKNDWYSFGLCVTHLLLPKTFKGAKDRNNRTRAQSQYTYAITNHANFAKRASGMLPPEEAALLQGWIRAALPE